MFTISSLLIIKVLMSKLNQPILIFISSFFMFINSLMLIPLYNTQFSCSTFFMLDSINYPIIMMTFLLLLALEMAKLYSFYSYLLMFFSFVTFSVSGLISFFVAFELNLIPIFLIILGWGYQPERIYANKMMMLYTLLGSLPLLVFLVTCFPMNQFFFGMITQMPNPYLLSLAPLMAFLVKLPIFSLHLWLPLAHVEAPLMGSMILAGILLKLGGYGLMRMTILFLNSQLYSTKFFMVFCAVGAAIAMTLCVTQVDLKVIIAYSSVGHMSMAAATIFTLSTMGFESAIISFVAHGFTSSLMFFIAGLLYSTSGTRHVILNKGMLVLMPLVTMIWFFACLMNAGGPPTMNLLAEILSTFSLMNASYLFIMPLIMTLMLGMLFCMKIFSLTTQGNSISLIYNMSVTKSPIMLSASFHLISSIILIMAMPFMMI